MIDVYILVFLTGSLRVQQRNAYSRFVLYDIRSILLTKYAGYYGSKFILLDCIMLLLSSVLGSMARKVMFWVDDVRVCL
jgi:hypothetical protein